MTTETQDRVRTLAGDDAAGLGPEQRFTAVYETHEQADPHWREAHCLRTQLPGMFLALQPGDRLAGRCREPQVGLSAERPRMGYYCALKDDDARAGAAALRAFWRDRQTVDRCVAAAPAHCRAGLPSVEPHSFNRRPGMGFPLYRIALLMLDYDRLLRTGLRGLQAQVATRAEALAAAGDDASFPQAGAAVLEGLCAVCEAYAAQAQALGDAALAADLAQLAAGKPQSFRQAVQLFWLYAAASTTINYGRMDVYLGDFYAADLAAGRITEAEAVELLVALWRLMPPQCGIFNGRVIVGGLGRRNPEAADAFAHLALQASDRLRDILPHLTLRHHREQDPALLQHALEVIGRGNTYPILYNDHVNVPAVAEAFAVPEAEAAQYLPGGCGEYILDHRSVGSPNAVLNTLEAVNLALRDGYEPHSSEQLGLHTGQLAEHATFDDLKAAFRQQIDAQLAALADMQARIYEVVGGELPYLLPSLLFDDCLARNKPLLRGGARYLGGTMEAYGNTTAADALHAIEQLVYRQRRLSPARLLAALDADFAGHEAVRAALRQVPKFGNDDPGADAMAAWLHDTVNEACREQGLRQPRLHHFLTVVINNSAHVGMGKQVGATADGRPAGAPMANGNTPTAGNDRAGVTALLNSMSKLDPSRFAGATHNLTVSPDLFGARRPILEALLQTYWERGGTQLMLTVVDPETLRDALAHPEQHGNLIVRVGGFSARFVSLPRDLQEDIANRTVY